MLKEIEDKIERRGKYTGTKSFVVFFVVDNDRLEEWKFEEDIKWLVNRVRELEGLNRSLRERYGRSAITCACRFESEDSDEPTAQCAYHKDIQDKYAALREALEWYASEFGEKWSKRARKALGRE